MTDSSNSKHSETINPESAERQSHTPKIDLIAKSVATGVAVSTITQTCRSIASVLAQNPVVVFSVGYFTHKYRKGILLSSHKVAEQGKDFVLRQRESFVEILHESEES